MYRVCKRTDSVLTVVCTVPVGVTAISHPAWNGVTPAPDSFVSATTTEEGTSVSGDASPDELQKARVESDRSDEEANGEASECHEQSDAGREWYEERRHHRGNDDADDRGKGEDHRVCERSKSMWSVVERIRKSGVVGVGHVFVSSSKRTGYDPKRVSRMIFL